MKHFAPIAATLLLAAHTAGAADRAVTCHDCTDRQLSQAATSATDRGTVHVFDDARAHVQKFRVRTEFIDEIPRTSWTEATAVRTDGQLRSAWRNFIDARDDLMSADPVILPPDFEIRSVAGAIVGGDGATTAIEQYLRSLSQAAQLADMAQALFSRLLNLRVPVIDMQGLIGTTVMTVEFPDGSQGDYRIEMSLNVQTGRSRIELEPHGNALDSQGRAVPTSALGFRNRTYRDNGGSLFEWISLARLYGINVGGGQGTVMVCYVSGKTIYCRVKKSK